jgi:hypothetical protein
MTHRTKLLAAPGWLSVLGISLVACSVDQRALHTDSDDDSPSAGQSSSPNPGAAGAASHGMAQNEGGAAGEGQPQPSGRAGSPPSPQLPPLVGGCADLDTDGVPDCSVTLVKNSAFESDVASWEAAAAASLEWNDENALADAPSGCALLSATGKSDIDGSSPFRASQCVAVPANHLVIAYANASVTSGDSADDGSQAQLEISFFDGADCQGAPNGNFFTPPSTASAWSTIQAGGVSGAATVSALVSLVGLKPYRAETLSVCFDNVMLKTKAR